MPRSLFPDLRQRSPVFAPAYRGWIGAGRKRSTLWRTLLGLAIVAACWLATTFFVIALPIFGEVISSGRTIPEITRSSGFSGTMGSIDPAIQSILVLLSFTGVWLGVWIVAGLLHRRSLGSVLAGRGRWRNGQFWGGFAVAAGFSALMASLAVATGRGEMVGEADPFAWGLYVLPLAVAVAVQSCGEEVLFRGYLQQQLAARFRTPWIWLILPSVLFGLLHGGEGWQGIGYVLITALIGIVAGVMVWRTGSLAAAMGLHFGNNFSVFLLLGPNALPDMLDNPDAAREMLTVETFVIDGVFFFALLLILLSARSPLRAPSRSAQAG